MAKDDDKKTGSSSDKDERLDRLLHQTGGSLPPGERKGRDRREKSIGPPPGVADRRKGDRRTRKTNAGRERYLDMVLRERQLFVQHGVSRTAEQLLEAAGVGTQEITEEGERDRATGDVLRAILPVQSWLPVSIHLIGLENAVLRIAPLYDPTERQIDNLLNTARRSGFKVDKIEVELWDRAELMSTLRTVHDLSADRCEKTLSNWLLDLDNGLLLNQFQRDMLAEALQLRASDIHIVQDNVPDAPNWIKYRVDGDLQPMHLLPGEAMARLTTLLKRDAGLNFGDRTTPKDGRFGFTWQGRNIDVRVAAGPHSLDGEKITMRLLDRAGLKSFDDLFKGHPEVGDFLRKMLSPSVKGDGGMVLLSGPTGSGKTTTLYASVQEIDRRRRHVLTIEDPIEYEMRYATQWQISGGEKGNDFAALIRAAMRHDPDYIVIGEMRDGETVETALRAAESGHTVISTIHADTAIQTLERLRSFMPVERERSSTYTLSQQINAILNQRLVKTLCQSCSTKEKAGDVMNATQLKALHMDANHIVRKHNTTGCDMCNRTGILGRALLLEALLIKGGEKCRNQVFNTLLGNVNDVADVEGVEFYSRNEGLRGLAAEGQVDPEFALMMIEENG